ncbi:MAG: hypothetical protein NT067_05370 [Candidatus Diapherotrites archaeon]|nr:hypothetical protein [Candidatus Diapherotrites archaeon]
MGNEVTKTEFQAYSYFWLKFGEKPFEVSSLRWFFSTAMVKKILFKLSSAGWLQRVGRGSYRCIRPEKAVESIFESRAEKVLEKAGMPYCFYGASAVEAWSDYVYMQRSWEHSPFFVRVRGKELGKWKTLLKKEGIDFFTGKPKNAIGEFVVLEPVKELKCEKQNGRPVIPLDEIIEFAEKNIYSFEYPLAYIGRKFKKKVKVSEEALVRVGEAL